MKRKFLLLSFLALTVLSLASCKAEDEEYVKLNVSTSIASQTIDVISTYQRTLPIVSNGGLSRYPAYGEVLMDATNEEKQLILDENNLLVSSSSTYDSMDEAGNLYLDGSPTGARLYKHSASEGMYYGNVSDDEQAVIGRISLKSRPSGNYITGLYAPAGEVIKIEMSQSDLDKTGGIDIYIGQVSQSGDINNIWIDKDFNRMPVIANVMSVNSETAYVGNYFGGPIYIGSPKNGATCSYTVTISGGVPYNHYIKGVTSKETFVKNLSSSAPYFDLEVWDDAVRHSGPNKYVSELDYEAITESADLWEKIASVSNLLPTASNPNIGISFLYDPFICAGSATAIVGRNWTNLPPEWMYESLHYDTFVESGAWGTIHEYNHHFQKFGFEPGDEVTNNAVSLIAYALFTNISSNRTEEGLDLNGWNIYTDAYSSLKETLRLYEEGQINTTLSSYADLLHSFGADKLIEAINYGQGEGGVDTWYKSLSNVTGYNMLYYFEDVLGQDVSEEAASEIEAKEYKMYIPAALLYQTGRGYVNANGTINAASTMQPYEIEYGRDYILKLDEFIVLPKNATYVIKEVTSPKAGSLAKSDTSNNYIYTPNPEQELSGEFYVKLSVTIPGVINDEEIIFAINLRQKDKGVSVKEYQYEEKDMYRNIIVAEANSFSGYTNEVSYYVNDKSFTQARYNTITQIEGKIYIPKDGTYRIYVKGNDYTLLYSALNSNSYKLSAYTNGNQLYFSNENNKAYVDYTCKKGDYIYYKEILLNGNTTGSIDLGWARIVEGVEPSITSIPNTFVINQELSFEAQKFKSEAIYQKEYQTGTITTGTTKATMVSSTGFTAIDDVYGLGSIFDDDNTTIAKTEQASEFEIVADLGYIKSIDYITIDGGSIKTGNVPNTFRLYMGASLEELSLVGYFNKMDVVNNTVTAKFDVINARYYKLVVTSIDVVQISSIELGMIMENSYMLSLDDDMVSLKGEWQQNYSSLSTFGHSYKTKDGTLKFSFIGSQFGIYINDCDAKINIKIDGGKKKEINLKSSEGQAYLAFISDQLGNGEHTIEVSVKKGTIDIESLVIR